MIAYMVFVENSRPPIAFFRAESWGGRPYTKIF